MDDAVRAREAALEALADVEPSALRDVLQDRLADASMTPGVLALLSAQALDPGVAPSGIAERAAGVQLIYEGLRLTRSLSQNEPWARLSETDLEGDLRADLEIVAADVLVSRGFYLLARTEAAERAVETVRSFGADQTRAQSAGESEAAAFDRNLEADVFALGVVAGATAVGADTPDSLLAYAESLARSCDYEGDLPPAAVALPDAAGERIASLSGDDRVRSTTDG
jgi:hypothetical protein